MTDAALGSPPPRGKLNLHNLQATLHVMKVSVPSLAPLFRSDTQGRLLVAVFVTPDDEHSITALVQRARTSVPTALREIDRAESTGAVVVRRVGNTRPVRANVDHQLYEPLRRLIFATYGPPAVLQDEFKDIEGIDAVLIFGSWAARYSGAPGEPRTTSTSSFSVRRIVPRSTTRQSAPSNVSACRCRQRFGRLPSGATLTIPSWPSLRLGPSFPFSARSHELGARQRRHRRGPRQR